MNAGVMRPDRDDTFWFRPVHCKSPRAQEVRALLVGRKLLQGKLLDVALSIRGILRGFGLKVGAVSKGRSACRIRELVTGQAMLDRAAAAGARVAARRVPRAAPRHAGHRARGRDLPSADDGAGGRRSGKEDRRRVIS
jgi:hypothetical protein